MCLDIAFYSSLELIDDYFPDLVHDQEFVFDMDLSQHFLAVTHNRGPIITYEKGNYHRKYFEWGIIAEYMNTPKKIKMQRRTMINARAEKIIEDKRSFWHRIRRQRCLIPVNGIYEHREIKGWKNKVPYLVQLKDREMFCIPGLYHYNLALPSDPETGEMRGMFTMITRQGNEVMRQIHHSGDNAFRMPLFLPKQMEMDWLEPGLTDEQMIELLSYEMPSLSLKYHTVASIRGKTFRTDGKCKYEEFDFPNLPPLGNDDGILQNNCSKREYSICC